MKIITWNVKGAANQNFCLDAQDLVNMHHLDIMVILEPKIGCSHVENVGNQVGLSRDFQVDPQGFSGGIWVLWESQRCNMDVVCAMEQSVTMLIKVNSHSMPWLFTVVYAS